MSLDVLILFPVAALTFAVMPGPAIVYVVARTFAGGRRAGFWASLGVHVGGYVHVLAAVARLAVLLHAVPMLYAALKLAWIGIGLIRQTLAGAIIEMPKVAADQARSRLAHGTAIQWVRRACGAIPIGRGVNFALSRT